tara:strand:+ start:852 stop:1667 length:816 start_codon:yes stop_codon:yes gene_type:complete
MAYIGKTPLVGDFKVVDNISVVNNQAAYNMQVAGVNVIPESSNNIICSLNGVIQKPGSSFTVSGSTITFSQNLVTGDVIDFIQILGSVLDIGTPSDGTVTESKIGSNAVTSAKMFSGFKNGITEADQFRLTANITSDVDPISSNLERVDNATFSKIGTGMSLSSGTFTFPTSGLYHVIASMQSLQSGSDTITVNIKVTANNSSYDVVAVANNGDGGSSRVNTATTSYFVNVTNTSNVKVRFAISSLSSGTVIGSTDQNQTCFTFIRLGDSQ